MRKTELMVSGEAIHPKTKASIVSHEHTNVEAYLDQQNRTSSIITQSSAMSQAGMGDDTDLSFGVEDGFYESATLYGKTLVNCIQEPSSQDVVLPYGFAKGQHVTIRETKESGALGVELKGQTLVNLAKVRSKQASNAVGEVNIPIKPNTKYIAFANVTYEDISNLAMFLVSPIYVESTSGLNGDSLYTATVSGKGGTEIRWNQTGVRYVTFTSTSNQCYLHIRTGGSTSNLKYNNMQVFEYQQDMENWDIPYFTGMASVKAPTVKTVGKNLFDGKIKNNTNINGNTGEEGEDGLRRTISVNFTKVKPGTQYMLTRPVQQGNVGARYYDINCKFLSAQNLQWEKSVAFTTPTNCFYFKFIDEANALQECYQIEEGSTATAYEAYQTSSVTLPEEVILRSLPNGVCDTYNTRTGEYVQRIGETTIEELSRFTSFSSYAWGSIQSHGAFQLYNIAKHIDVECSDQWMQTQNMWSDNYVWANAWHGGSMSNPNPNDNLPNVFLAFSNDGHLRLMVRKTLIKPDSPQDVTANDIMDWGRQNVILSTRIQYQLKTPIITKVDPKSVLKPHNTTTHIYTEIPQNSLYPILSHSNPTYPVILKPSTKYSIVANSYSNNHTNSPINFNLGGATASTTVGNRVTMVTTPSTLSNELLTMSGKGNKLNNVMVIEGDVVGDEPYFEGICDVKSPVVKNVGKNLFDLNGEWVKCTYSYGVPQAAPYTPTITISNNGFSITSHINSYNSGFGQYVDVSSLDILYVRATAIYTDTKTVPELKIIGLYENESIPSSVNSTNSSDFKVITKKFSSEQEVSFDLDVRSYSKIFMMFSGGWKSEMSGSYTFTMKNVYIGSSNQTCEPHKSNTTAFNQKDGQTIVLRSLQNGVCDTLNVETGECVSNIAQIVLNGSENENWKLYYDASSVKNPRSFFITLAEGQTAKPGQNIFATDRYPVKKLTTQECAWYFDLNGHKIAFSDIASRCADVSKWREYLKANPITLCYQRISPIITTIDVQGFPYAYKDGHIQLSSDYNGQSLTPKLEYIIQTNRAGAIQANQDRLVNHEKRFRALEMMILHQLIQLEYRRAKGVFLSQTRQIFEGGIQMYHAKYDLLSEFIEKKLYRSLEEVLEMLDVYFMLGDLTDGEYDILYERLMPSPKEDVEDEVKVKGECDY